MKHKVYFEHAVNEKSGAFFCDNDTPIDAVKDMLVHFLKLVSNIEDEVKARQAAAAEEAAKSMPTVEVTQDHCVTQE